jgi:predicted aspartyl protease/tetratricopeptide (TPR) repeat protein
MKTLPMFRHCAALLGLALASFTALAVEPCVATRAIEMPVEMIGPRAVVQVGINGTQVPLVVDSGAFFSFLSPAVADRLKLKLGELSAFMTIEGMAGEIEARLTTVDRMQLQGSEIPNIEFIVGGNEVGAGAVGILGRNLLTMTDVEYDLANGMIRMFVPQGDCSNVSLAYWATNQPYAVVPLVRQDKRVRRPAIRAVVQINGVDFQALFDTGAPTSLITLDAAKRAGITMDQLKPAPDTYGGGQGSLRTWDTRFASFALGGEKVENVRMQVVDRESEDALLIGADFFLAHRIYVSKAQHRMYFTHNGGPVFGLSSQALAAAQTGGPAASNASAGASEPALDAAGYARRGAGKASRHDYAAALADLDRACAMAPDQADYFVRRGVVHQALRQGREALEDFDAALRLQPSQSEALLRRASLRDPTSGREAALADLKTLNATLPAQAPERLPMARLYERFAEPREAIAQATHWAATRETDIDFAAVLSWRCALRAQLGVELDQALADCDRAVDADGKDTDFRENRGLLRLKRGEADLALADFEKALALKPDAPWALYGRAIVRSQRGQHESSRADLEAARKLRPQIEAQLAKFGLPKPG